MKIDEQNAQEKIMDDLLRNIYNAGVWYENNKRDLDEAGRNKQNEKIARLTFLYNGLIQKRIDKSSRLKSLYQPGEQSEEEKKTLFKLIEDE